MAQRAQQREQTAALKASYRAAARGLRRRIAELEGAGSPSEAGSDPSD
jgi:hypothetical protein